jgi:hypothetical protein
MDDGTKIKKFHNLVFINGGTPTVYDWKQIRKATDNAVTMNAETTEYDYIVDESPTLVLEKYKPGMSLPITMYKGEADYEFFYDKYYNLKTGADAESKILLIDYAHGTSSYNAWLADCVVVIDSMNPVESTITANITMNGTIVQGTATVTAGVPVFTAATETQFVMTFTASIGATPEAGATIQCGGVTKITDDLGKATFTLIDGETYTVGVTNGTEEASDIFVADSGVTTMALAMA